MAEVNIAIIPWWVKKGSHRWETPQRVPTFFLSHVLDGSRCGGFPHFDIARAPFSSLRVCGSLSLWCRASFDIARATLSSLSRVSLPSLWCGAHFDMFSEILAKIFLEVLRRSFMTILRDSCGTLLGIPDWRSWSCRDPCGKILWGSWLNRLRGPCMKILKVPRIRGCLCECSCWMLLAGSCEQIFQDSMMILSEVLRCSPQHSLVPLARIIWVPSPIPLKLNTF